MPVMNWAEGIRNRAATGCVPRRKLAERLMIAVMTRAAIFWSRADAWRASARERATASSPASAKESDQQGNRQHINQRNLAGARESPGHRPAACTAARPR